jgi:acetyl-CoA synthetase
VARGERVFFLCERIPELYFGALGALAHGAVIAPLFSSAGPEAIRERLGRVGGSVLVTTPSLLGRLAGVREELPALRHVIAVAHREASVPARGWLDYRDLVAGTPEELPTARTSAGDGAVLHFTSGSTGRPKGALLTHAAAFGHEASARFVLGLRDDDVFWCTADPGWVTGTSFGMFAPWLRGVTNLSFQGGFGADRWYELLERHRVTVWYTAPTALRLLARAGTGLARRRDLSALRHATCSGEPLDPATLRWALDAVGVPVHDQYWQSETGTTVIANVPGLEIRPGSMGRPVPGVEAAILGRDGSEIHEPMREGSLALRPGFAGQFAGYWGDERATRDRFRDGWYWTGDRARRDASGYFWFVRREDDVINTAGHLVGPFEVERALLEHPAVAEAAVIGKPHPVALEVVKAFVTLRAGHGPSEALRRELLGHARRALGAGIAPREIEFALSLPRTRSGKLLRRVLRARELGLPEGDVSTLEEDGPGPELAHA